MKKTKNVINHNVYRFGNEEIHIEPFVVVRLLKLFDYDVITNNERNTTMLRKYDLML